MNRYVDFACPPRTTNTVQHSSDMIAIDIIEREMPWGQTKTMDRACCFFGPAIFFHPIFHSHFFFVLPPCFASFFSVTEAVDAVASSSGADEKVTFNADKDTDFNSWYEQILICAGASLLLLNFLSLLYDRSFPTLMHLIRSKYGIADRSGLRPQYR